MFKIRDPKKPKSYNKENLLRAYEATQSGTSVYRAARLFNVPESTLRDRTRNLVELDATRGPSTLFSRSEERQLVDFIEYMASIGYGYSKTNIQYIAADLAVSMGKEVGNCLSHNWFYGFIRRWPELKVLKPQKLHLARAKGASEEAIENYFKELGDIIQKNNLSETPQHIYNIDETGVSTEHNPPKVVCGPEAKAQAATSPRSANITIIAGVNALGNFIPPYYVFPGKRWSSSLLDGAPAGASGTLSDKGWSNSAVFEEYLKSHFAKYMSVSNGPTKPVSLVLFDGHKSHISLTLSEWAKQNNVILFVLPPHTSHLTQPLDVGLFGPFKSYYYRECQLYLQKNPGISITRYEVARLTAKPYLNAMSPHNISSAFCKAGIFPFDKEKIKSVDMAPAAIYEKSIPNEENKEKNVSEGKPSSDVNSFLESRKITAVISQKPKKRFVTPFKVSEDLSNEFNLKHLQDLSVKKEIQMSKSKLNTTNEKTYIPSTSGVSGGKGGPLPVEDTSDSSDEEMEESEVCCVCNKFYPDQKRGCENIIIVNWVQCETCSHWTHLAFCSPIRVLRRASSFKCPHCY